MRVPGVLYNIISCTRMRVPGVLYNIILCTRMRVPGVLYNSMSCTRMRVPGVPYLPPAPDPNLFSRDKYKNHPLLTYRKPRIYTEELQSQNMFNLHKII